MIVFPKIVGPTMIYDMKYCFSLNLRLLKFHRVPLIIVFYNLRNNFMFTLSIPYDFTTRIRSPKLSFQIKLKKSSFFFLIAGNILCIF